MTDSANFGANVDSNDNQLKTQGCHLGYDLRAALRQSDSGGDATMENDNLRKYSYTTAIPFNDEITHVNLDLNGTEFETDGVQVEQRPKLRQLKRATSEEATVTSLKRKGAADLDGYVALPHCRMGHIEH